MFENIVEPRFGEIDGLKHLNNNVIGNWFELGRNNFYKIFTPDLDLDYKKWRLIVARTEYDFLKQIYYNDKVKILSFIIKIGNSSFTIKNEAWQNNILKAKGKTVLVNFDFLKQKPIPIPENCKKELKKHYYNI